MPRFCMIAGAANMLLALMIAAATGHQLQTEFVPVLRNILDTAREMHFVHALALVAVGIVASSFERNRLIEFAGFAFLTGITFFCGGIYAAYDLNLPALKPMIPLGGIA
ncbi:MAG: DUF423 domain-containing protein, partial [Parvibaculum sp.]|nr:DUF423 domain-containing protein [Parvibaculum sp.]